MTPPVIPAAVVVVVLETPAIVSEGGRRRRDEQGAAQQGRAKDALHNRIPFVRTFRKERMIYTGPSPGP
jgi:hypothetical protein